MRRPREELCPFVQQVWAAEFPGATGTIPPRRELMLPAASAHLVVRIDSNPLEIFADREAPAGAVFEGAAVGGPRWKSYVRTVPTRGRLVGVVLSSGSVSALLGLPASELVGQHAGLDHILGSAVTSQIHDRAAEAANLEDALRAIEDVLLARAANARPCPAAVTHALARFTNLDSVAPVIHETGYSHRRFNDLFRDAVGLTPKIYCRLVRLNRLLQRISVAPHASLAAVAVEVGYSDQAHMSRDFRDLTGITLTEYCLSGAAGTRHVPIG